jgi:tetratricopeptide (TPR) repeat protein
LAEVRVRKKDIQAAKRPDAVLESAGSIFGWMAENWRPVAFVSGAILLAILVVSFVRGSRHAKEVALGSQLAEAVDMTSRSVDEKPPAEEDDTKLESFPSKAEKEKSVNEALTKVSEKEPGSAAALSAGLDLAQIRFSEGKFDDAISLAQKYLDHPDGAALDMFADEILGDSYEAKGDFAKADEAFKKMGEAGAPGPALFAQARLLDRQGKKDEARKLYEKVNTDYEKDPIAAKARTALDLMNLPLPGTGALAKPAEPEKASDEPAKNKSARGKTAVKSAGGK